MSYTIPPEEERLNKALTDVVLLIFFMILGWCIGGLGGLFLGGGVFLCGRS